MSLLNLASRVSFDRLSDLTINIDEQAVSRPSLKENELWHLRQSQ